jgi:hypothetical protein
VATYTADAVALLGYLVDALPEGADRAFASAEAGEVTIETPATALAETLYSVSRDKNVRGVALQGTPDETRQALVEGGPVSLAPTDTDGMVAYARAIDEFGIHDAFVVASHRSRETNAVITTDGVIRDAGVAVLWE